MSLTKLWMKLGTEKKMMFNTPQQGWQCPLCNRVYAPTTHMCFYCPPKVESASNTSPLVQNTHSTFLTEKDK